MVGVDVSAIERVRGVLDRYPRAESRFFTTSERSYCRSFGDPATHFAGTLAAKEAVVKALGLSSILVWARRIEIAHDEGGAPVAFVRIGGGNERVRVSISHDADVAIAIAVAGDEGLQVAGPALAPATCCVSGSDFP